MLTWALCLLLAAAPAPGLPTARLHFDPETLRLEADVGGRRVVVWRSVEFVATRPGGGRAFSTANPSPVHTADGRLNLHFDVTGPAAAAASVSCRVDGRDPRVLRMTWTVSCRPDAGALSPWTTGIRMTWAANPVGARTRPLIRWRRPTGRFDWEVPGDAPYPTLDRQVREVDFGAFRLIALTDWYDPDWFYGRDLKRVAVMRLAVPSKAPRRAVGQVDVVVVPHGAELPDEAAAALAHGWPVAVWLRTGRTGNVFAPGEPLRLDAHLLAMDAAAVRLRWTLWDYYGRRLASGDRALRLAVGRPTVVPLISRPTRARPGIYFLDGMVTWCGGETLLRTTLAAVAPRTAGGATDEASPFGVAAITANPRVYPDQPDLDTVLRLCERIGVRWIRGFGFSISERVDEQAIRRARETLGVLRRHGIAPHVQCGQKMPADEKASRRFAVAFARSLEAFRFLSRYIEVGNELNFSTPARRYVELLLKPQFQVMRTVHPAGRVMTMGLGGVSKTWWAEFVAAGGLSYADVISVHPGHHPRAPEFWQGWDGWVFRPQMLRVFDALDRLALRDRREVWTTEAYSPSAPTRTALDLRTAADYMVREYVLALAMGVRVVEWYRFQDGTWFSVAPRPDDGEWNYGMVYTDLTPKPQFVAYATMTAQLDAARCLGRLDLGADDLYGVRFVAADGRPIDVLWSYRERHECDLAWWPPEKFRDKHRAAAEPWQRRWKQPVEVVLPATAQVTVTDIMGNTTRLQAADGRVRLRLTGSPVFVRGLGRIGLRGGLWP